MTVRRAAQLASLTLCFALLQSSTSTAGTRSRMASGSMLLFAPCHGASGRGDGDAALFFHPPADLRSGVLQPRRPTVVRRVLDGRKLALALDAGGAGPRRRRNRWWYLRRLPASIGARPTPARSPAPGARPATDHVAFGRGAAVMAYGPARFTPSAFRQTVSVRI
jgi:hypothetical protein